MATLNNGSRWMSLLLLTVLTGVTAIACTNSGATSGPTPLAMQTSPEEVVGRLFEAEKLVLELGHGSQVYLGAQPPDFGLPLPEGTRVVGSIILGAPGRQHRLIALDVPLQPQKTLEFFRDTLARTGWEGRYPFDQQLSLFVSDRLGLVYFCKEGIGGQMGLQSADYENGLTPVRVFNQDIGDSKCQDWPRKAAAGFLLPPLTPPEGQTWSGAFTIKSTGKSGQDESVNVHLPDNNLAPGFVEQHFRGQLIKSGWILKERGGSGPVSWSTWNVKDREGSTWNGSLVVAVPYSATTAFFRLQRTVPVEQEPLEALAPRIATEDEEALGDLLERFFAPYNVVRVRILPGALPPVLRIPLMPGATVVGSVVFTDEDTGNKGTKIILDVAMEPYEVERFFQEELSKIAGWRYQRLGPIIQTFVNADGEPARSEISAFFCNEAEDTSLSVAVLPFQNSLSEVFLSIGRYNQLCDLHFRDLPPTPILNAPSGTTPIGSQHATLVTNLAPIALEEHFRGQLMESDWVHVAHGASGPTAWSTWELVGTDGKPWVGRLLLFDMPDGKSTYAAFNIMPG